MTGTTQSRLARYRRGRQWTIAGAGWAAGAVLLAGVVPTFARLARVTADLRRQTKAVAAMADVRQSLEATGDQVNHLEQLTSPLHQSTPAEQQIGGLIADVRRIGQQCSLDAIGWTPGDRPERAGALSLLPVRLHVAGDYTGVLQFMSSMQSLPRPIRLRDVAMTADSPGSGRVDVRLTVDLVTAEAR